MSIPKEFKLNPIKEHVEGEPWTIVRFKVPQYKRVLPLIAENYHFYFSQKLIGYIFVQANPEELALMFFERYIPATPIYNSLTKQHFVMPDDKALKYISIIEDPSNAFSIAPHPLEYYANGHERLICVSGPMAGSEGYIIRAHRNRKFVFSLVDGITFSANIVRISKFLTVEEYNKLPKSEQITHLS